MCLDSTRTYSYSISNSALRWLEVIFAELFGNTRHLTRTPEGMCLVLAGAEGEIVSDQLTDEFTQAHSDQPCKWWDASSGGWHSVLGGLLPAPGVAVLPAPLIETRVGRRAGAPHPL